MRWLDSDVEFPTHLYPGEVLKFEFVEFRVQEVMSQQTASITNIVCEVMRSGHTFSPSALRC